ncbi:MAG: AAA family ATPase, partial [Sphaerochaetaceae bacterium]|nr:AAA family ATPase [Sphaerochaetaceae bacterium]
MFLGRDHELNTLNNLYCKEGFSMAVIYGRRRIGKSTLISEFIKGKRSIFYTSSKIGAQGNLDRFSEQVLDAFDSYVSGYHPDSLEAVLDLITRNLSNDKLILVIDELPYWADKDESILSIFQKYIDTEWKDKSLMLILCGSALSFMENKVLSEKSPLFGRRDNQIKLEPFDYKEASLFVPLYSNEDKAITYAITGGVAKYLSLIEPTDSLDDNIKRLFFNKNGYLYEETTNYLLQEFSDTSIVNKIIEQIANGENSVNIIASKVGESESNVIYFLDKLVNVGLVEKRRCMTEESNKKKTQYILKDQMFKFWYTFIPKALSVIETNKGDVFYDLYVKPRLHSFMGSVFEVICRTFVMEQGLLSKTGIFVTSTGSWWGIDNQAKQTADIDVVAVSEIDKSCIVGECKFKNEAIDINVYETL